MLLTPLEFTVYNVSKTDALKLRHVYGVVWYGTRGGVKADPVRRAAPADTAAVMHYRSRANSGSFLGSAQHTTGD